MWRIWKWREAITAALRCAAFSLRMGMPLIVKTEDLLYIIAKCKEIFPEVERISVYGAPKDILHKTPEELAALKAAGLDMVYMGLESGCG